MSSLSPDDLDAPERLDTFTPAPREKPPVELDPYAGRPPLAPSSGDRPGGLPGLDGDRPVDAPRTEPIAPTFEEPTDLTPQVGTDAPDNPQDTDRPITPTFEEPTDVRTDDRGALRPDASATPVPDRPVAQETDRPDARDGAAAQSWVETEDFARFRAETEPAAAAALQGLARADGDVLAGFMDGFTADDDIRARTDELLDRAEGLRAAALADRHVDQIARDNPEQIERYWLDYQSKVQSDDPPGYDFARYVELVQRSQVRPGAGEWNLAAERGAAGEVVMTDPGRPNDRGIDLVSYAPSDGTIRLFDDKSVSNRVREVSALDQNLAVNLRQVAEDLAARAARGAPGEPHLPEVVDRLSQAAERIAEIEAAAQDRERAVQRAADGQVEAETRNRDQEVQRVLDDLRIQRVVTNTAGPAEAAVSARLRDKGFRLG